MKKLVVLAFALGMFLPKAAAQSPSDPFWGSDGLYDKRPHQRGVDVSLMAWLPWYYGFGLAGDLRVEVPILPDGFVPALNDELDIEGSLSVGEAFGGYYAGYPASYPIFAPAGYLLYALHLTRQVRVYGGLGLGWDVGFCSYDCAPYAYNWFYWDLVAGVNVKLTRNFALRGEVGSQGLKGGVQIYF